MKRIAIGLLALMILLGLNPAAADEWIWQSPLPQANSLTGIQVFSDGSGMAVGQQAIFRTTNLGQAWTVDPSWAFGPIEAMSFISRDTGWVCTTVSSWEDRTVTMWWTTNGGQSWDSLYRFEDFQANEILFLNRQIGFAVGHSFYVPTIYQTTDGGHTWSMSSCQGSVSEIYSIDFMNEQYGWAAAGRVLLKTTDGGSSWSEAPTDSTNPFFYDITFTSPLAGLGCGLHKIYRTTDGGITWRITQETTRWLRYIMMTDPLHGWAGGDNGLVLRTNDGGLIWTEQISNAHFWTSGIFAADANSAWIITDQSEIIHTTNGGENWILQAGQRVTPHKIYGVSFPDTNNGWLISGEYDRNSTIARTTNGGTTWSVVYFNAEEPRLTDILARSPNEVWCVDHSNELMHTTNGGTTWEYIALAAAGGSWGCDEIQFVDADTGFVVKGTIIFRTVDGGATWDNGTTLPLTPAISMTFVDGLHGWVSGGKPGFILHTVDGGLSWTTQLQDELWEETVMEGVYFVDRNHGWAGGWYPGFFHTTDGGTTWLFDSLQHWSGDAQFDFSDPDHGWMIAGGNMLRTVDGGLSWQDAGCPTGIFRCEAVSNTRLWAVGDGGTILRWNGSPEATDEHSIPIPHSCVLEAFPNPFNPATSLTYTIPHGGRVTMQVFDIAGRKVATLADQVLQTGEYTLMFDGSRLPSGIYFVQLNGRQFSTTAKIVLLK